VLESAIVLDVASAGTTRLGRLGIRKSGVETFEEDQERQKSVRALEELYARLLAVLSYIFLVPRERDI
jgi:hypothetical protein